MSAKRCISANRIGEQTRGCLLAVPIGRERDISLRSIAASRLAEPDGCRFNSAQFSGVQVALSSAPLCRMKKKGAERKRPKTRPAYAAGAPRKGSASGICGEREAGRERGRRG